MVENKFANKSSKDHRAELSRRTFLKGVGQLSVTAALHTNGFGLFDHAVRAQSVTASPVENPTAYQETGREIIDDTTKHIHDLYQGNMTEEEGYIDGEYRLRVCQEIALAADRLNPKNPNLGNQMAAQILMKTSFKTLAYPSSDGSYKKVTPLEQVTKIEEYFRDKKPDDGYWNLRDLYEVTGPELPDKTPPEDKDPVLFAMEETIQSTAEHSENPNFLADPRTQRKEEDGLAIEELGRNEEEQLISLVEMSRNTYSDHEPLARLMATQLILESGLENPSDLFNLYNNPFGMKGIGTHGAVYLPTTEQDAQGNAEKTWAWFQAHATLQDGFAAHRELMDWENYDRVWDATTFEEAADYIVNPGEGKHPYATDVEYTEKLLRTYNEYLKPYFEGDTVPKPEEPPTLFERLEEASADFKKMQEIADANTRLYGDAGYQYLCLQGVRLSINEVMPEMNEPLLVGSAYMATDVFSTYPDQFAQIEITNEEELYELPPGAILVYPPNIEGSYDFASGKHHGHIGIIIGENEDGEVIAGSDHHSLLSHELANMEHTPEVFVPILPKHENKASPGEAPSISHTAPQYAAIEAGFGIPAPEYYESVEEYEQAIKSEFGVIMNGFSKTHLEWAWEKLWSNKHTNFSELAQDSIYVAKTTGETTSHQEQCEMNGLPDIYLVEYSDKAQFQRVFSHEAGHFDHCRDWIENAGEKLARMQEIIDQEGPISDYGATSVTENYADMIMYTLDPADGYVSIGEGTPDNPIYNDSKPLHAAFAREILFS